MSSNKKLSTNEIKDLSKDMYENSKMVMKEIEKNEGLENPFDPFNEDDVQKAIDFEYCKYETMMIKEYNEIFGKDIKTNTGTKFIIDGLEFTQIYLNQFIHFVGKYNKLLKFKFDSNHLKLSTLLAKLNEEKKKPIISYYIIEKLALKIKIVSEEIYKKCENEKIQMKIINQQHLNETEKIINLIEKGIRIHLLENQNESE